MGLTKQIDFEKEINDIAETCRALGHPARIQIMTLLLIKNNRTCGEIVAVLPLAQSTVSKHLLELKKATLLNVKNIGKKTIYSVNLNKIEVLKKYLSNYISNTVKIEEVDISKLTFIPKNQISMEPKLHLKKYNYQFPHKKNKTD
ncbi:ArsR/SmtB family transcription factor [Flavobacterium sp. N3904]|uniref:ArsR/SmtB family transcription factor n=1 Tax=Flavobacterium sp. N3904 TaxID=2986835 RepID=UPI0022245862|nr:metalloregulator ArsR/SmtB family transcription factor [Flavobacterium sp. N3904]